MYKKYNYYLIHSMEPSQKIKVLVVDDDKMCQTALTNFSKKLPIIELTVAGDGQQAIDKAKATQFDLIFMDLFMPVMNGYEATKFIRTLSWGKTVKIVALSGDEISDEDLQKGGFDHYIHKPCSRVKYEAVINGFKK